MSIAILRVKRMHPAARLPAYATKGSACFDLHALFDVGNYDEPMPCDVADRRIVVRQRSATVVRTGLAFEIPPGFVMQVYSRSGHGFKNDIRLANAVGIIDADYRGEIMVKLTNDSDTPFIFRHGDRIAQAMLVQLPVVHLQEVDELSATARGAGGLGSTGV